MRARQDFARTLFHMYPGYRPTKSLCLDLEGSGSGAEAVCSMYWPQLAGADRFQWVLRRSEEAAIDSMDIVDALDALKIEPDELEWVTVFSPGLNIPAERDRFEVLMSDILPNGVVFENATWVNLHFVLRRSSITMQAIRKRRYAWKTGEQRVRYSLEALEHEFGIARSSNLRSHSNSYADGVEGTMRVLETAQSVIAGEADIEDEERLYDYCLADVKSMFTIAQWCKKNFFV